MTFFKHTKNLALRLWKDDEGATAAEYAIIVALLAVAVYAGFQALGGSLTGAATQTGANVATGVNNAGTPGN